LLLDQYPRNSFRGTQRMYESDEKARSVADAAIRAGRDLEIEEALALFVYLPFARSESLADQERSVSASVNPPSSTPKVTATSSGASGASRTEIRFSAAG